MTRGKSITAEKKLNVVGGFLFRLLQFQQLAELFASPCYWVLWMGRASYYIASIIMVEV